MANGECDRLYAALAFFDTRDGTFEANLVRAAREGYERSAPDMAEPDAWAEFDRLLERHHVAMKRSDETRRINGSIGRRGCDIATDTVCFLVQRNPPPIGDQPNAHHLLLPL